MLSYVFLLACLVPAMVTATNGIRACTGGRPSPDAVRVFGCDQTPCEMPHGTSAVMQVDFRATLGATALRPVVFATALGVTIEYELPPAFQNGCNQLDVGSCPLSVNEDATFHFEFPITTIYPPIPVAVELTLVDQLSRDIFCAIIDIQVRLA